MINAVRVIGLILFTSLLVGCDPIKPAPKSVDFSFERAHAAVTLGKATSLDADPNPSPNPGPTPGSKCLNCKGTGKLGDSIITVPCPVCGGDGIASWPPNTDVQTVFSDPVIVQVESIQKDDEPERSEAYKVAFDPQNAPNLIVYSRMDCSVCKRWSIEVMPKLLHNGWKVLWKLDEENAVPNFVIIGKERVMKHVGFLSENELRIKAAGL